jgi:hypothetical protein
MGDVQPVIVLGYQHGGSRRLQQLLAADRSLACTAGIELLPACDQAAAAWRQADGRPDGPLSALAAASVRSMTAALITAALARTGQQRWCEIARPGPAPATFLDLFPGTRYICLHRSCPDVIRATLTAHPWGLAGLEYARYMLTHPASTLAALAAYWAEHTELLLAFERDNPAACIRVRYEDMTHDNAARRGLWDFLGLDPRMLPDAGLPAVPPGHDRDAGFPAGNIPPGRLARLDELHADLGYPPVSQWPPPARLSA